MLRLLLVLLVATSACAQSAKPDAAPDPRERRADSVIASRAEADTLAPDREAPVPLADAPVEPGADTLAVTSRTVGLGARAVEVRVTERPTAVGPRLNALNLHDDESTSVEAALAVARERGGRVVELAHGGDRNVTFRVGGQTYVADPNRMFTPAGRRATLARHSRATRAARAALAAFADSVLAVYVAEAPAVVVTLHNNTEANYSAASYLPGAVYASDAAAVTVHDGTDPDDFFFVTDRGLYDALVARGYNAVLQDNDAATDDGSLSVWAAREGVPYVNVEAQHGHAEAQAAMIAALLDVLAE